MKGVGLAMACTVALSAQQQSAPSKPGYYDEPSFIVAGVADPSARGGHGSDPVQRSADALTKATASLRTGEEKRGTALEVVREYQRIAEADPSEVNLFNWGTELLNHRAADQAVEVFTKGARLYPRSTRTLLGLAVALYSRGSYDQAAQQFFAAADLNPRDPAPYLFLGKISSGAITESAGLTERLERFAKFYPENAWANYYYATSLWKQRIGQEDAAAAAKVEMLLEKAVHLDPDLGAAFLELGVIHADQGEIPKAISAFESAIKASPSLEEAHYRLAQAYRKVGDLAKAEKEIELYRQLSRDSEKARERERSEIQQFVFELRRQ